MSYYFSLVSFVVFLGGPNGTVTKKCNLPMMAVQEQKVSIVWYLQVCVGDV